jgi:hypothetical protein
MTRIEEELRATFARHEAITPPTAPLRARIDQAGVRAIRRRTQRRIVGVALAVLVGAVTPVVLADRRHGGQPVITAPPAGKPAVTPPADPVDLLLIGSVEPVGEPEQRADTIALLHIAAGGQSGWLVSLPSQGRYTSAGGAQRTVADSILGDMPKSAGRFMTELTGVTPDDVVSAEFSTIRRATAAVGGAEVCLDRAVPAVTGLKGFAAGCQQIEAGDVEALLSPRSGVADATYGRDRNAVALMRALTVEAARGEPRLGVQAMADVLAGTQEEAEVSEWKELVEKITATGIPVLSGIADPSGGPEIYSGVAESLYQAIQDDRLAEWAAGHPEYVID